jgi:hypothetical protein
MKKLVLSSLFIGLAGLTVTAQNVTIPDANFKSYLVGNASINTNSDSEIQVTEAAAFTGTITCNNLGINSVTGLEAFTGITGLYLFMNNLTSLDVSANTALYILNCRNNQLTALNLSNNLNLLDVNCSQNDITSLDLSLQTSLIGIDCTENLLTSLNVANGNNSNVININFMAQQNPFLTCIEVDDAAWSTTNWVNHDAGASFSEDCGAACVVSIPDANFKAYLVGNTAINTNTDTEIQCSEAASFTGSINCSSNSIANMTGIESFTALTALDCSDNQLTSLNISSNTALTLLNCSDNQLTALNVSSNTALAILRCFHNELASLSVSTNTALTTLNCYDNQLTSLNISGNTALTILDCRTNLLTALNVKNTNNSDFISFTTTGNPLLTCIQVDDEAYSTTNWTGSNFMFDAQHDFSENCILSVEESQMEMMNSYPNPASEQLFIEFNENSEITIVSLLGETVQKCTVSKGINTIDVTDFRNGIYFIQTPNGSKRKFVKG